MPTRVAKFLYVNKVLLFRLWKRPLVKNGSFILKKETALMPKAFRTGSACILFLGRCKLCPRANNQTTSTATTFRY
jgi:hypothetical protein